MYLEQAAEARGRFEEAVDRGRELIEHLRSVPFTILRTDAYNNLCLSLTELGRFDDAVQAGREALREDPVVGTVWTMLDTAAWLAFKRGHLAQAAQALGRADAAMLSNGARRHPNEARIRTATFAGLREALPPAELDRLLRAGAALKDDEAAILALGGAG